MQDWSIPLAIATAAFFMLLLWRFRPVFPWTAERRAENATLRAARAVIAAGDDDTRGMARDDHARATALCDAADVMAKRVTGAGSASGLYLRAVRADPSSVEIIRRATLGLSRRPRALESLLWRHLGIAAWTGPSVPAVRASLESLRSLYEGRLRNAVRARALSQARDALR